MKEFRENKKNTIEVYRDSFYRFSQKNKKSFNIVLIMIFLTYGFMLFHFSFSIDTEDMIIKQMDFYDGWFGINRYGLVFTKWITGVLNIVPGFATILMVIMTAGYSLGWMYFFYWLKGEEKVSPFSWVFPVLFFSSVSVIELMNFQCLSFEVSFAMMICALALLFEWKWIIDGGKEKLVLSVVFGIWCFASYQAFVPVYISASLVSFILVYQYRNEEISRHVWLISGKLLGVFLGEYLIYSVLGKVLVYITNSEAGTYTDSMILWGKKPVEIILLSLKSYVGDILLARNLYWNWWYLLVVAGLILTAFWKIRKKISNQRYYLYYVFVLLLLLASPFFLPILMGAAPVVRGQLALPFVAAIGVEMLAENFYGNFDKHSFIQNGMIGLLLLLIIRGNIVKDNRLLYTEYMVWQQEQVLTYRLTESVDKAGGNESSTVVILGHWTPTYNPSMLPGETLGRSFYEWDIDIPGATCRRILSYWNALGYKYEVPTDAQIQEAENIGMRMPLWPQEGSVIREENMIIIRLSE